MSTGILALWGKAHGASLVLGGMFLLAWRWLVNTARFTELEQQVAVMGALLFSAAADGSRRDESSLRESAAAGARPSDE